MAGTWHIPDRMKAEPPSHHQGHPRAWGVAQQGLPILSKVGLWGVGPIPGSLGWDIQVLCSPLCIPLHRAHLWGGHTVHLLLGKRRAVDNHTPP